MEKKEEEEGREREGGRRHATMEDSEEASAEMHWGQLVGTGDVS